MSLETPYPYQLVGAKYLSQMPQAFLADDMGLGKSCQAVVAADMIGAENILVLCPGSVRANWEREFDRFSPMDRPCRVLYSGKDTLPEKGVVVCSYDLLKAFAPKFKTKTWDVLILDEAHYLKERSSDRTRYVYGHGKRSPGLDKSALVVWRLSGTPAPNWADELYTHLKSAGVIDDPYWDFTFRYCTGFDSTYGYKITGHKNVDELKKLLGRFMLRRTKEEVMAELPPIQFQQVVVDRSPVELDPNFYEATRNKTPEQFFDELKVADTTLRQALDAVAGSRTPDADRLGLLSSMGASLVTLRRYLAMAKLPSCLDIIEEELKSGQLQKIVIFGVHMCTIEGSRERLAKYGAVTIYGKTPAEKRQRNIDRFVKDPKCRVFIGNIQAAGTGVDGLQKVCSEVAFFEQDWVPGNNAQAAMRVHRNLQTKPVRVRIFSLAKSVDEQVQLTLSRKAKALLQIF